MSLTWDTEGGVHHYNVMRHAGPHPNYNLFEKVNTFDVVPPSFSDGGLAPSTKYWYIVNAVDASGHAVQHTSPFTGTTLTGPPSTPGSPLPTNGAAGVAIATALDWSDCGAGVTYNIYLWPSSGSKPGAPTASGLAASNYTPATSLASKTAYSWQVVAHNAFGDATGPIWSFTSGGSSAVDAGRWKKYE